jgi:predicted dehydrogenase
LDAGVDVLVEKPIALSVEQAEDMVEHAAVRDRILQVGHIERFNGAVIALFESVKHPLFIECHRLSPYPERSTDVSVVLDLMIHDLDIVSALVGSKMTSVDAVGVPVFSEQEDIANVRIRFASGCVANITASRVSVERMRKIRIFAENMYVSTDYSAQEVLVYRKKGGSPAQDANPMDLITVEPLPVKHDEPLKLELAAFVECVSNRTPPVVSGRDAIEALKLAQQIETFIREHQ